MGLLLLLQELLLWQSAALKLVFMFFLSSLSLSTPDHNACKAMA
jgi:hypothetical protein